MVAPANNAVTWACVPVTCPIGWVEMGARGHSQGERHTHKIVVPLARH
jgi:hypothetical protein